MRIFATDTIKSMMGRFNIPEDEPIQNKLITNSLEKAQEKIEGFNFDARKNILEYDDVLNFQRSIVYTRRKNILTGGRQALDEYLQTATENLAEENQAKFRDKLASLTEGEMTEPLRRIILQTIDMFWVDHLETMDYLRSSVNLRAYGQRDPLVEYKREGLRHFQDMEIKIAVQVAEFILGLNVNTITELQPAAIEIEAKAVSDVRSENPDPLYANVGRNDLCPCGSGKKYKKCHGA